VIRVWAREVVESLIIQAERYGRSLAVPTDEAVFHRSRESSRKAASNRYGIHVQAAEQLSSNKRQSDIRSPGLLGRCMVRPCVADCYRSGKRTPVGAQPLGSYLPEAAVSRVEISQRSKPLT
jgi:hypothetical protein